MLFKMDDVKYPAITINHGELQIHRKYGSVYKTFQHLTELSLKH